MSTFADVYTEAAKGGQFLTLAEREAIWRNGSTFSITRIETGTSQINNSPQWVLTLRFANSDEYLLGLNKNPVRDRMMEAFAKLLQTQTSIGPARLARRKLEKAPNPMWDIVPGDAHLEDELAPPADVPAVSNVASTDDIPF